MTFRALSGRGATFAPADQAGGTVPPPPLAYGAPIGLADARLLAEAAQAAALGLGVPMVVAVVEPAGDLVVLHKMDGAQYGSIEVAVEKARAAARFRRPTKVFEDLVAGGRAALLALPGVVPIEGGVPIVRDGRLIGAVGASGGTSAQDGQVAAAGLAALA